MHHRRRSVLKRPPPRGQRGGRLPDWLPACPPLTPQGRRSWSARQCSPCLQTSLEWELVTRFRGWREVRVAECTWEAAALGSCWGRRAPPERPGTTRRTGERRASRC